MHVVAALAALAASFGGGAGLQRHGSTGSTDGRDRGTAVQRHASNGSSAGSDRESQGMATEVKTSLKSTFS